MANIFELFGKIVVDNSEANKAISDTSSKASQFASAMKKGITDAAKWGAGIATAATAATVAIGNQIKKIVNDAASMADTIDKASARIGFSTAAYQEWEYVLNLCGANVETLESGMKALQEKMYSVNTGSTEAIRLFGELGISCFDLNGEMKDAEVIFEEVVYKLAEMTNESERTQLAQKLFSEGGVKLAAVLNSGAEGIDAMREAFRELGIEMDEEAIAAGVKYTDTVYTLNRAITAVKNNLAMVVMPYITKFAEKLTKKIPEIRAKLEEWEPVIDKTIGKIESGLEWIIDNPEKVKESLDKIGVGFLLLLAAVNPVKAAIMATAGFIINMASAISGIETETGKFKETLEDLDDAFYQSMKAAQEESIEANALLDLIEDLGSKTNKTAVETMLWKNAIDRMEEILPGFKDLINEETGEIQGGTQAIRERIDAMQEEAEAKAAIKYLQDKYDAVAGAYASTAKLQFDIETNTALLPSREAAYLEAKAAYEAYDKAHTWKPIGSEARKESERLLKDYQQKFASYNSTLYDIESAKKDLEKLHSEIKKAREELAAAEKAINGGAEGLENTLNAAAEALEGAAEALENTEVIPELAEFAENKMQEELNDMGLTVGVTPVINGRYYYYPGSGGTVRSGARFANADTFFTNPLSHLPGHADGLDYVPFDNYVARLHKGEKVLTANEASAYRSGEGNSRVEAAVNRLYTIMGEVLTAIREGQVIQLDTGALVGQTAGAMNNQLGALAVRSGRRN